MNGAHSGGPTDFTDDLVVLKNTPLDVYRIIVPVRPWHPLIHLC